MASDPPDVCSRYAILEADRNAPEHPWTGTQSPMLDAWNSLPAYARYSVIAAALTAVGGLVSMGMLGALLYYPISPLLRNYPSLNEWHGDWVWPAMISVGMGWSAGFLLGGTAWHLLAKLGLGQPVLGLAYGTVLWLWAAFLWTLAVRSYA